ncbi:hypothetical protein PAN31117_05244 [Pandoraea anapnoica]|uniref:Uncharacterized protein n=2 Tax=Pandoraea anapnoica TaxID=2508301 RepID=A0A5E5ARX8_9BURK|nr:hypothetical protein [Pandoraea iniqua]VVE59287.1 hypothetical protein PIN31009_05484 [Pandoraea iniqua]VVE75767.1 hypothetical protein PAN31117_05244 [Pandoraea anapnoica]
MRLYIQETIISQFAGWSSSMMPLVTLQMRCAKKGIKAAQFEEAIDELVKAGRLEKPAFNRIRLL